MVWTLTTVGVNVVGLKEPDFKVVQDGRLVQVAQGCQVILPHQDVWIAQEGQLIPLEVDGVFVELKRHTRNAARQKNKNNSSFNGLSLFQA